MSWEDRLRSNIILISPEGDEFTAKWRGNPRTMEKKLGIFNYPNVKGSIVQDLDVNGINYPLTIYFDGQDHDQESERFMESSKQNGLWQIEHPVKGSLLLQLVNIQESILPVENGSFTMFETNWLETITDQEIISITQLESDIDSEILVLNELATEQFNDVKLDTFSKIAAIATSISSSVASFKKIFSAITSTVAEIDSQINAIQRGIQDTLDAVVLDPLKLAAQIQNLIQLPALIITDFKTRFDAYTELAEEILGLTPDGDTNESFNTALSQELVISAILAVTPQVGATSEYLTRAETLSAMESINVFFNSTTNTLDSTQSKFEETFIDNQYFSQSKSYTSALKITALSNQLLLNKTFDLLIARTLILKRSKTPIRITLEEYGSLGDNDVNIDLFISSNNLSGNDILLLPAGREVVVYA